ncbi:MAG TPA: DNA-binding response regulator [Microscillaceae bacterium]|nr:DNA-binding response regulator [Microscillaceae bacterium]
MMKCLIVDDEEMAIKVLESHIEKVSTLEIVATCANALEAFAALQEHSVDLIFLDIQMPRMSGFGLLKTLPHYPQVIITTAHRDYALESYEFVVTDYLLKPISFERFLKSLTKVKSPDAKPMITQVPPVVESQEQSPAFFYVRSNRQFVKINLEEVHYIESLRNHVTIVTDDHKHTTLTSIGEMEEKLPPQHFLRIHRGFIVAIARIQQFTQGTVIVAGQELPIGSLYKKTVLDRLSKYLF